MAAGTVATGRPVFQRGYVSVTRRVSRGDRAELDAYFADLADGLARFDNEPRLMPERSEPIFGIDLTTQKGHFIRPAPAGPEGALAALHPTGVRNYARLVPTEGAQGAADACLHNDAARDACSRSATVATERASASTSAAQHDRSGCA